MPSQLRDEAVLNPHGSDETDEDTLLVEYGAEVLNPHGSDETQVF